MIPLIIGLAVMSYNLGIINTLAVVTVTAFVSKT